MLICCTKYQLLVGFLYRAHSSSGRARGWHSRGDRFKSGWVHTVHKTLHKHRYFLWCISTHSVYESRRGKAHAGYTHQSRYHHGRTHSLCLAHTGRGACVDTREPVSAVLFQEAYRPEEDHPWPLQEEVGGKRYLRHPLRNTWLFRVSKFHYRLATSN